MTYIKPTAAPGCWGRQYQDGEKECEQCRYNDTCRLATISAVTQQALPERTISLPVVRNYAPPSVSFQAKPTMPVVPLPTTPYYPPAPNTIPLPKPVAPPVPQAAPVQAQPQNQYYQSTTGYSLPNPRLPNPLQAMHRPGAPAPAYYFTQYPGESVSSRVGKNLILRALEAIFAELMQFFRHWTWPPSY